MVRRSLIGLGALALTVPFIIGPLGSAGATSASVRLQGSMPRLPNGLVPSGAVPKDQRISVKVQLRLRDQAGADALINAVSTPGSAKHHQYLTPDQFHARFSPTDADVAKVSAWLTKQGLAVTSVPANRFFVQAEGSAAQVEATFATSLATVESNGKTRRVNTVEPSIPSDLVASVEGITGLSETLVHPNHVGAGDEIPATAAAAAATGAAVEAAAAPNAPPSPGFRNAPPCSTFWNEKQATGLPKLGSGYANPLPWAPCGWKPADLRSAYGTESSVAGGIDGSGVTVGIVDAYASPTIFEDAPPMPSATTLGTRSRRRSSARTTSARRPTSRSATSRAGTARRPSTSRPCTPWLPAPTSSTSAPPAASTTTSTTPSVTAVDGHWADIISNSYGNLGEPLGDPAAVRATLKVHTQAALQGIGIFYSSGDSGDESNSGYGGPVPSADWEASSPLSTAVGGTSLGVGASGQVVLEQGWTTGVSNLDPATNKWVPGGRGDFLYGAGGGPSRLFEQPDYQKGVVPNGIARGIGAPKRRVVPDVGMVGDPNTGMLDRPDADLPRGRQLRRVPHRWHQPLVAALRRCHGAGRPAGRLPPRLRQPVAVLARRHRSVSGTSSPGPRAPSSARNYVNSVDATAGLTPPSARTIDADLQTLRTPHRLRHPDRAGRPERSQLHQRRLRYTPLVGWASSWRPSPRTTPWSPRPWSTA